MDGDLKKDSEKNDLKVLRFERKTSATENVIDSTDSAIFFGDKSYKMNHASRGRAIIFNHNHFINDYSERKGTEMDVKNLYSALQKIGFEPEYINIYDDLPAGDIMSKLKTLQQEDHTDRDMLMIFVLTHGGQNDKVSAFDVEYAVENLWEPFTADKCKSLAGKPKLFFVIACRGDYVDQGRRLPVKDDGSLTEVDARPIRYHESYSIPVWSDFLYVFSTYKGYYSYRNVEEGTWYIQAFCEELSRTDISQTSFTDFLTAVNGRLSMLYEGGTPFEMKKQIPIFSSTLTKRLYLRNDKG